MSTRARSLAAPYDTSPLQENSPGTREDCIIRSLRGRPALRLQDMFENEPVATNATRQGKAVMDTLIVCSANVCRSPAAEALWRAAVVSRGIAARVSSAGLQARPGARQSATMAQLLAPRGITMADCGATVFLPAIARRHQLVLVMEPSHQRAILSMSPDLAGRVHLLGRWGQGPIEDPMGGPVMGYRRCIEQMDAAVNGWLARLTADGSQRGVLRNDKELARAS